MSTTLRPAPPRPPRVEPPQDLDALIEEARRRARRRRRWYAATALLAAGAAASAFAGYHHGGGGSGGARPAGERPTAPATDLSAGKPVRNGALTILGGVGISAIGAGGDLKPLFRCIGVKDCNELESVAWSPDGNRLAFGVASLGATNHAYDGLNILDRHTGKDWRPIGFGHFFDLAWSPDGSRLAFVDSGFINMIDADGSGRHVLFGTEGYDYSPSWSPDGTSLVYASVWDHLPLPAVGTAPSVYVVDVTGRHRRLLVTNASSPAWSPRGNTIAYKVDCGIRLITPSGRDMTPASPGACKHIGIPGLPSWSPDGRKIAIVNGGGTFVMNADGSRLRRLTRVAPRLMTPAWPGRRAYAPASWQPLR